MLIHIFDETESPFVTLKLFVVTFCRGKKIFIKMGDSESDKCYLLLENLLDSVGEIIVGSSEHGDVSIPLCNKGKCLKFR